MSNLQLYLAIGVPMLFNAILFVVHMAYINAKIEGLSGSVNERFASVNGRFDAINQRFDDMRDLWRA